MRNEFSRPWMAARIGPDPVTVDVEADPGERDALARRFDLQGIESLAAHLILVREIGDVVRVEGDLKATVTQTCIVSLEPVPATVDAPFVARFSEQAAEEEGDIDLDPDADDPPEPIENGSIDLGELVAQELSVALDPYPRAPGATAEVTGEEDGGPFAALAARLAGRRGD